MFKIKKKRKFKSECGVLKRIYHRNLIWNSNHEKKGF